MGTIAFPNIAQEAGEIAATPQNALAEYARTAQLKQQTSSLQQEQQERALQMKAQQRQLDDQDALTKAMTQYDPQKHSLADVPKLITSNGGSGQAALSAQAGLVKQRQDLSKLSDEQFAQEQKKADLIQGVHDEVSQAPPELKQQTYQAGLQKLSGVGVDTSKESPQYPGDDEFAKHLPAIRLHSAIVSEAEKDRETSAKESEAATKATEAQTSQQKLRAEMPGGPLQDVARAEMADWMQKNPDKGPSDFLSWKAKQNPTALVLGNQLGGPGQGSALDQAAERYSKDGTLPSGFARSPGTTSAIIKRSAELHPDQDLASNKATFSADTASLKQVQKQFDSMNAFEGTALKNLQLYADTAKKIPDLGAKFANVPLRMITGGMIGTDNMAALNAARQTASSEVAKVLSSATGSGVLSDTQKKEAQEVIDGNLPLSATLKVVETLKQDMTNRHQSYQADIDTIKGRLGAKTQTQTQPNGGQMIRARDPQGKLHEAPAGTTLPQGWKAE